MEHRGFRNEVLLALRTQALAWPEVTEGDSCVKRGFRVRRKSFLFLGEKDDEYNVMVKLGPSLEQARALASARPDSWSVGKGGWAMLKFAPSEKPPAGLLERWLEESFRLQAPKKLLAALPAG